MSTSTQDDVKKTATIFISFSEERNDQIMISLLAAVPAACSVFLFAVWYEIIKISM